MEEDMNEENGIAITKFTLRMPTADWTLYRKEARKMGVTMSTYIRDCLEAAQLQKQGKEDKESLDKKLSDIENTLKIIQGYLTMLNKN